MVVKLIEVFKQFQLHMILESTRGTKDFLLFFSIKLRLQNIAQWFFKYYQVIFVSSSFWLRWTNKQKKKLFPVATRLMRSVWSFDLIWIWKTFFPQLRHEWSLSGDVVEWTRRENGRFVIAESRRWASWVIWQINFIIVTCSAHLVLFDRRYSPAAFSFDPTRQRCNWPEYWRVHKQSFLSGLSQKL